MTTLVIPTEAPAVPGPPQGQWRYADWEDLPDDGNRYEIIDGVVYMTPAPSSFHQWITGRRIRPFEPPFVVGLTGYRALTPPHRCGGDRAAPDRRFGVVEAAPSLRQLFARPIRPSRH